MKAKAKKTKKSLVVNSKTNIPEMEKLLASSNITIVLIYADWCGACHKFRDNIWDPMLKSDAMHNRIAVRDDMVKDTSLSKAKFDYLPSILVVDEKGDIQTFQTPEGKITNAMPTPTNVKDMTRIVNVPVTPSPLPPRPTNVNENFEELELGMNLNKVNAKEDQEEEKPKWLQNQITPNAEKYNYTNVIRTTPVATPRGTTYIPMKGGSFQRSMSRSSPHYVFLHSPCL